MGCILLYYYNSPLGGIKALYFSASLPWGCLAKARLPVFPPLLHLFQSPAWNGITIMTARCRETIARGWGGRDVFWQMKKQTSHHKTACLFSPGTGGGGGGGGGATPAGTRARIRHVMPISCLIERIWEGCADRDGAALDVWTSFSTASFIKQQLRTLSVVCCSLPISFLIISQGVITPVISPAQFNPKCFSSFKTAGVFLLPTQGVSACKETLSAWLTCDKSIICKQEALDYNTPKAITRIRMIEKTNGDNTEIEICLSLINARC